MSESSTAMTKTKLVISGMTAALAMLGLGFELFVAREVSRDAPRMPFPVATQPEQQRMQQSAAEFSRNADSNWNEAIAKNKERSREYLERFNNDGFLSKDQEAYMEELAKERKPTYAATGLGQAKK